MIKGINNREGSHFTSSKVKGTRFLAANWSVKCLHVLVRLGRQMHPLKKWEGLFQCRRGFFDQLPSPGQNNGPNTLARFRPAPAGSGRWPAHRPPWSIASSSQVHFTARPWRTPHTTRVRTARPQTIINHQGQQPGHHQPEAFSEIGRAAGRCCQSPPARLPPPAGETTSQAGIVLLLLQQQAGAPAERPGQLHQHLHPNALVFQQKRGEFRLEQGSIMVRSTATTVAVRGASSKSDSSPTKSPGPNSSTVFF